MNRKNFIKKSSIACFGLSFISGSAFARGKNHTYIKPPKLNTGDTIALVAPGSYISEEELQKSIDNINALGYEVYYSDKLLRQTGYFSASDTERAEDLMNMFQRKDVKGIFCARGGYGCARILPFLNYEVIRSNAKVFVGYSDVTAIHLAILKFSGLITFHGPVATSTFNDFTKENFESVLVHSKEQTVLENSKNSEDENVYGLTTLSAGIGEGRLIGGNLSIVVSLIGTEYDIETKDKIVFLEEIGEEPYRIDRMLTQLLQSGKFNKAAGIALGIFKNCESKQINPSFEKSFSLMEVLKERLGNLSIPVVYGLSFGHLMDKFTLPVGAVVRLDSNEQIITLLESAVV